MTLQHDNESGDSCALAGTASGPVTEPTPAGGLTEREALLAYRDALLAATSTTGLVAVELRYSGAGDEGRTDEICLEPEVLRLDDLHVDVWNLIPRWQPASGITFDMVPARRNIGDVMEEMSGLALAACNHGCYETGDGGNGVLRLDLHTGALTLEHHDHYLESVRSFHDLSDVASTQSTIDMPDAAENGIQERKVSFGGCGGAGDDC